MVVQCWRAVALSITTTTRYNSFTYATLGFTFVSFTNRKVFPCKTAFLHVNVQLVTTQLLRCRQTLQCWCRSTPSTLQCRRYHSYANYLMAGGRLPQQLQHWPGFWALDWMLGPLLPALIRISPCIGSLHPHLCRHAVVQSASSNRDCWLLTHAPLFGPQTWI